MDETQERQPLLRVENLTKTFDVTEGWFQKRRQILSAVDDVSFDVYAGETLGIVGESGCGKSTLANVIMGVLTPTAGRVLVEGQDINSTPKDARQDLRANMQMVFQDPVSSLNPRMRVGDIIGEPLRTHRVASGAMLRRQVEELMEQVGLDPRLSGRFPHEFSGGQRQRIAIARAIALRPRLVVCDEPVSALDVSTQAQVLNLLKRLQRELSITYVVIAHGLPVVHHISDRVAVMYLGKVVELADRESLFQRRLHPYSRALIASVPVATPALRDVAKKSPLLGEVPSPVNPPPGCRFASRCPIASDICRVESPPLTEIYPGHAVACHHPMEDDQ